MCYLTIDHVHQVKLRKPSYQEIPDSDEFKVQFIYLYHGNNSTRSLMNPRWLHTNKYPSNKVTHKSHRKKTSDLPVSETNFIESEYIERE